jgi:hypothetical protein
VLVRCTAKALNLVGRTEFAADALDDSNEWYLNLLWFERRKCLLLVHASTLYPTFVTDIRKPDLVPFGVWASTTAAAGLVEEGLDPNLLGQLDPSSVATARTASRRILGFMNDMALHIQHAVYDDGGLRRLDVAAVNHRLRRTLHQVDGRYVTPMDLITAVADPSA